jgi:hypothetical protein
VTSVGSPWLLEAHRDFCGLIVTSVGSSWLLEANRDFWRQIVTSVGSSWLLEAHRNFWRLIVISGGSSWLSKAHRNFWRPYKESISHASRFFFLRTRLVLVAHVIKNSTQMRARDGRTPCSVSGTRDDFSTRDCHYAFLLMNISLMKWGGGVDKFVLALYDPQWSRLYEIYWFAGWNCRRLRSHTGGEVPDAQLLGRPTSGWFEEVLDFAVTRQR